MIRDHNQKVNEKSLINLKDVTDSESSLREPKGEGKSTPEGSEDLEPTDTRVNSWHIFFCEICLNIKFLTFLL